MSIRFAAPATKCSARMTPDRVRGFHTRAANDNGDLVSPPHFNAALRQFAKHGLSAAQSAHDQAITAFAAGDHETFLWWRDVCRALDRRIGRKLYDRDRFDAC
ncbi:hypothetical protein [Aurantiacibacter atlanticus]|nr:hypothetical protein [Aurantiacibacter atlanticus]